MATGRFFKLDGTFSDETFHIPDELLQEPMKDTEQEWVMEHEGALSAKLDGLKDDEICAMFWLWQAYRTEGKVSHQTQQRLAIEALLGPLNMGEWLVLGKLIYARYPSLSSY